MTSLFGNVNVTISACSSFVNLATSVVFLFGFFTFDCSYFTKDVTLTDPSSLHVAACVKNSEIDTSY